MHMGHGQLGCCPCGARDAAREHPQSKQCHGCIAGQLGCVCLGEGTPLCMAVVR
jgi:hypothetical protein